MEEPAARILKVSLNCFYQFSSKLEEPPHCDLSITSALTHLGVLTALLTCSVREPRSRTFKSLSIKCEESNYLRDSGFDFDSEEIIFGFDFKES